MRSGALVRSARRLRLVRPSQQHKRPRARTVERVGGAMQGNVTTATVCTSLGLMAPGTSKPPGSPGSGKHRLTKWSGRVDETGSG